MTAPVRIYTTDYCPYCVRAKQLLGRLGLTYEEIDVTDDDEARKMLVQRTGMRTVPQIFFGDKSVGGFTDLDAIVRSGKLESVLAEAENDARSA